MSQKQFPILTTALLNCVNFLSDQKEPFSLELMPHRILVHFETSFKRLKELGIIEPCLEEEYSDLPVDVFRFSEAFKDTMQYPKVNAK